MLHLLGKICIVEGEEGCYIYIYIYILYIYKYRYYISVYMFFQELRILCLKMLHLLGKICIVEGEEGKNFIYIYLINI